MDKEKNLYFFLLTAIFVFIVWSAPQILKGYSQDEVIINDNSQINTENKTVSAKYSTLNTLDEGDDLQPVKQNIDNDDRLSRLQVETNSNMSTMLTGLLILLIFTSLLFINLYRNKNLINEELNKKNHEINLLNAQFKNQNQLLSKSELELKSANEAKDKFFSIIAHDLMNPNQALMGYAQLLKDDSCDLTDEELKEISSNIYESTKSQQTLLKNLLTWARSQTGRIEYQPKEFLLTDKVERVIQSIKSMLERKKIIIKKGFDENISVYADPEMICTVLRNLVSNAIKYSDQKSTINILAERNKNDITITIQDNGIGMDHDSLARIFNAGNTVSTLGTSNEAGTGLGLLICKEFVELNGGEIWVESELDIGSKFSFTLPAA